MYLNLASINDLNHFTETVAWPVSEAEKESFFGAIEAGCIELLLQETGHFQQQILRGILPTVVNGCLNVCYSGIVYERLLSMGSRFSNYRPSPVDYFSWRVLNANSPEAPFLTRFLAPYVGCFLHLQNVWLGNLISDCRRQNIVSCHVHHFRVCRGPTNERVKEDCTGAADETYGSLPTLCSQSTAQQS